MADLALNVVSTAPPLVRLELLQGLPTVTGRKLADRIAHLLAETVTELGFNALELEELSFPRANLADDGWVHLPLEEGGEARLRVGPAGACLRAGDPPACTEDERALAGAERGLLTCWHQFAQRWERALIAGRAWSLAAWQAIVGRHPIAADLATRLLWSLWPPEGESIQVAWAADGFRDVFGDPIAPPAGACVRLAHPTHVDPEELELWREWAMDRSDCAPFPQVFRAVATPSDDPFADFVGRKAYKSEVEAFARQNGWTGAPLLGSGPWELRREEGGVHVTAAVVEIEEAFRATLAQRRAAHRTGQDVKTQRIREAKPRVRLTSVQASPAKTAVGRIVLAEAVRQLHDLTDSLNTVDELGLRAWQKDKWRDPKESWREVVLRYRCGSSAAVDTRRALIEALTARVEREVRLEDRFAIVDQVVVELGTGLCHQGPPKDHLPSWKVDERLAGLEPPNLPFLPQADPKAAEVVTRVTQLALLE